jgi:hypothetical protein
MKIYISHSTNFDFKKDLYTPIKKARLKGNFILPHERSTKQYPAKKLFFSKKCDLVVAEVSYPSTGQGIELAWANINNIPIICLHKTDTAYSKSLRLISKKFIPYKNTADLLAKIEKII